VRCGGTASGETRLQGSSGGQYSHPVLSHFCRALQVRRASRPFLIVGTIVARSHVLRNVRAYRSMEKICDAWKPQTMLPDTLYATFPRPSPVLNLALFSPDIVSACTETHSNSLKRIQTHFAYNVLTKLFPHI
jgi:hypothetical protein